MIHGITVVLYDEVQTGTDEFNRPIMSPAPVNVDNVLVTPITTTDIVNNVNLTGKKAVYTLAIPKGDTHEWRDRKVTFFGDDWRTFGEPIQGIESEIPLEWNMKVQVERYE